MRCVMCKHGETAPGLTIVTLNQAERILVFKDVPADVCSDCGEYYLTAEVSRDLLARSDAAVTEGAEVAVQQYMA
jgi:YgiT-type zinc finger domain-containing protein